MFWERGRLTGCLNNQATKGSRCRDDTEKEARGSREPTQDDGLGRYTSVGSHSILGAVNPGRQGDLPGESLGRGILHGELHFESGCEVVVDVSDFRELRCLIFSFGDEI